MNLILLWTAKIMTSTMSQLLRKGFKARQKVKKKHLNLLIQLIVQRMKG